MAPERINTCRGVLTWVIRAACLLLAAAAAYLILQRVALAVVTGDLQTAFTSWADGIGARQPLYCGIAMLAVAGVLGAGSQVIPRWVFPAMPEGCPRCGYEVVAQERCPECGLTGFNAPSPSPPTGASTPVERT